MSSTTVRYREAEFIANDLPIEIWMFEVARQLESRVGIEPWLEDLRAEWRLQATSGFGFGPSPTLDCYLHTDHRRELLASYFQLALRELRQRGEFTPAELSQSMIGGREVIYTRELPAQLVIEVGQQFLALLSQAQRDD